MSITEIMQSKETQDLLKRVANIEAQRETKTVAFMPLFGMYAPTDTGISTEEQLNEYLSKEKDIVANYERSIVDEYSNIIFEGKNEWYSEQENHYRTRLTDYLAQHKNEYQDERTLCYLAEMKARYIDVDSFNIDKKAPRFEAQEIVEEKAGIKKFMELAENDYIILDTETTGFSKTEDDVIELGITDINGNVLYDGMFKPDRENSPEAESVNHISNAELKDKPTILEEWEKIKAAVAGRKIATYNLDFDKNIMINAAVRHGVQKEEVERLFENSACIMLSYTAYKDGYRASKLQNALTENGIEVEQDHRAVSDCKVTAQLVQAVREQIRDNATLNIGDTSIDFSSIDSLSVYADGISNRQYDHEDITPLEIYAHFEEERYIKTVAFRYDDHSYPTEDDYNIRNPDAMKELADTIQKFAENNQNVRFEISSNGKKETIYPTFEEKEDIQLARAKELLVDFFQSEYGGLESADFHSLEEVEQDRTKQLEELNTADLHNIGIAHTTLTDEELPIQVTADLIDHKITYEFDGEVYKVEQYSSLEVMNEVFESMEFSELVSVPDDVIERHVTEHEQERSDNQNENEMNDTYTIYQLKEESQREYGFMPYSANEGKVSYDNYNLVYQGSLEDIKGDNDFARLNYVYNMFNLNHPDDFTGHSLSMSDVVLFKSGSEEQAYYVDRFGFAEMPEFVQQKNRETENIAEQEQNEPTAKKAVTLTEHSAAIESTADVPSEPNFSSLNDMELYRIIVPNATQTKIDVLNNVVYPDKETAQKELVRMGFEEVSYETMMNIVGENMIAQHEQFAEVYETERPTVHVEWSEHHEIKDNSDYSLSEFSHLMEKLDKEWIEKRESGDQNYEGYAKTKFVINNAYGGIDKETGEYRIGTMTCRQDIGDGDGSLANHVRLVAEGDLAMIESWGKENIPDHAELEQSAKDRINVMAPYISYAVSREDNERERQAENTLSEKNSIVQNDKSEPQALMSIELSGEIHYFKSGAKSADEVLQVAHTKQPLLTMRSEGEEISSEEYAEIQQSDKLTFSVEMDFDNDTANIYVINDGKGGISEGERTDENTSITNVKITEWVEKDIAAVAAEENRAVYAEANGLDEFSAEDIAENEEEHRNEPTIEMELVNEEVTKENANDVTEQPTLTQATKSVSIVIGNTPYRFIKDKAFINTTESAAKEVSDILDKNGVKYSGLLKGNLGTITVSKEKLNEVMTLIRYANIDLNKKKMPENIVKDENGKVPLDSKEAVDNYIKEQIKNIMDSKKFIDFCKSDSLFLLRRYSLNNALLIRAQNPKATHCCAANQWQQFGRIVNKGATGLKIQCPVILNAENINKEWERLKKEIAKDFNGKKGYGEAKIPNTDVTVTGYNGLYDIKFKGKVVISRAEENLAKKWIGQNLIDQTVLRFNLGTVFDISQTNTDTDHVWLKAGQFDKKDLLYGDNGKPITNKAGQFKVRNTDERKNSFTPYLSSRINPQDKEKMALLYDILKEVSHKTRNCPVMEDSAKTDKTLTNATGYFAPSENKIVIREDLEITEKVATLLHEMGHSQMHNLAEQQKEKTPMREAEVQAEAVACLVANNYGIDTETSSFDYIAQFVESRNLDYLEKSLKVIWDNARELAGNIEDEINARGLDLRLDKVKEPLNESQIKSIQQNYSEIAQEIKEITAENIHNTLNAYKQSVVDEVKVQKKEELALFDKMTKECDKVLANAEKLGSMESRPEQEHCIGEIKAGFERITVLSQKTANIERELKELNLPETPQQEFLAYPMNYMNKDESFKNVSIEDRKIIAQSKFIAENYSHLLNTSSTEFVKYASKQAENIRKAMSKNGTAVEIVSAEYYGTKVNMEKGMVMHPVLAEKSFKQTEMEIGLAKKKAERNGEQFPSAKTDVTVYSNLDTITVKGIAAIHTSVYVGDGNQMGLAEHLSNVCTGKGLARAELCDNFYDSQAEKGEKTRNLYRAEIPPMPQKSQEQERQAEQETHDLTTWKDRAAVTKSERESEATQEQNEKDNSEKSDRRNTVSEEQLFDHDR